MTELRPYQHDHVAATHAEIGVGRRRILQVAPAGAGKTVTVSEIIRQGVALGKHVLFLAHRRELIHQAHQKLYAADVDAGIILAEWPARPEEPVQIASIQTLWARAMRTKKIDLPLADLVVIDEAHHCRAMTYRKIIEAYPEAIILGMTATPCRGDGRGLGNIFETMVECPAVQELIDLGFLVPTKVYAPVQPDLKGVGVARGDYVEKQLAERMDQSELVGDIVTHWLSLSERRRTVAFATGVAHSVHIRDEFRRAGILAEHIDGTTPVADRETILAQLSRGEIEVVSNCMVLTEGWDQPDVSCIILARPTKHMGLYRQMIGRVLRPAPGKVDAIVLDHAGAVFEHGFVEDPVEWTLDEDKRADNPAKRARGEGRARALTTCPECSAVRMEGSPCVVCGWKPTPQPEAFEMADGELGRVDRAMRTRGHEWTADEKAAFHRQLLWIALERGYKPGWAAHKHKEKFGDWPNARSAEPEPPDPAVRSWVRSRQIAYAKAMSA